MSKISIYIHVPFCKHKCIYCDFYSIITEENIDRYVNSICKEISFYSKKFNDEVETIFFGGGTPSLLDVKQIGFILDCLRKKFKISNDAEITLETNPGTVDLKKLVELKAEGINRISIGVQTFNESELKFLTRIHDKNSALNTITNAEKAGFENISLDLIFNLPKQTKEIWKENLATAIQLPITHISTYSLILEKGTILNKLVLDGKVTLQNEDYDADLYEYTIDFLSSKGFIQYEVSNFCKPGYECKHNLNYWHHKNYLGFGPSAHSFYDDKRWWNFSSLKMYIDSIESKSEAVRSRETLDLSQREQEYLMLALRSDGLKLIEFEKTFGKRFMIQNKKYLDELKSNGYLININQTLTLTKKGYLVCDEVLVNLK
ncbi:MAG: radical SAM family heme chaperone HemW [Ignavibacteriales bacterium]